VSPHRQTSLPARCTHCGAVDLLSQIANGDGLCPSCRLRFCDDAATLLFLRDVLRVDIAYRILRHSLRDLAGPAVALQVLPEPLFEGLAAAVAPAEPVGPPGRWRDRRAVGR
jgi:hypothetical protein